MTILDRSTNRRIPAELTTEAAESSYGIPVLILHGEDGERRVLGPGDPAGELLVVEAEMEELQELRRLGYGLEVDLLSRGDPTVRS